MKLLHVALILNTALSLNASLPPSTGIYLINQEKEACCKPSESNQNQPNTKIRRYLKTAAWVAATFAGTAVFCNMACRTYKAKMKSYEPSMPRMSKEDFNAAATGQSYKQYQNNCNKIKDAHNQAILVSSLIGGFAVGGATLYCAVQASNSYKAGIEISL